MASHRDNEKAGSETIPLMKIELPRDRPDSNLPTTNSVAPSVGDALKAAEFARLKAEEALRRVEQLIDIVQVTQNASIDLAQNQTNERTTHLRRRWRVLIFLITAVNVLQWIGMIYTVQDVGYYKTNRPQFLTNAWLIVIMPLIPILALLFSPFPTFLRRMRNNFFSRNPSENSTNTVNFINALLCFVFVALYLYISAVPAYTSTGWEIGFNYVNRLPLPAIAVIIPDKTVATDISATLEAHEDPETEQTLFAAYSTTGGVDYTSIGPEAFSKVRTWLGTAYVLDPSSTNFHYFNTLDDSLYIYMDLSVDSSVPSVETNSTDAFDGAAGAYVIYTLFDPRLNLSDILNCSLLPYSYAPAFSGSDIRVDVTYLTDNYNLVQIPRNANTESSGCGSSWLKTLRQSNPPFTSYGWRVDTQQDSSKNSTLYCDRSLNTYNGPCSFNINLEIGNRAAQTAVSKPGISRLDIWLGAGSITGAVQFFAWFARLLVA